MESLPRRPGDCNSFAHDHFTRLKSVRIERGNERDFAFGQCVTAMARDFCCLCGDLLLADRVDVAVCEQDLVW